jgi:signal transduction histidine kinase
VSASPELEPDPVSPPTRVSRHGPGLRGRLVLLTTVGLAVGLIVGGVVLTLVLRFGLERAVDSSIEQTAQEVALLVASDRLPDPVVTGGTTVIQVLDDVGRVLAASPGADRLVAALPPEQLQEALDGPIPLPGSAFGVLGTVRAVAVSATDGEGAPSTVLVATPASDIEDAVRVVRISLIVGFAVLLAVLALVAWRLVGATLRPVEALRVGAQRITGTGSAETLPLPNSADEIRRLAETLNDMLGRLEASRLRQRAFVADAAHELRSPLASLRTQLDVAVATGDVADTADLLAEVERLTRLVNDLLLLARVDDAAPPPRELLDLASVVAAVADRYAAQPIPITLDVVRVPEISADPRAVDRILANVLDNAVRYASSSVLVSVGQSGGGVVVVIADDGPGIPADQRARVFERFARLQDARDRDSGGTGLGLAIVAELIGAQGGRVRLLDAEGGGLRVKLWFPAAERSQIASNEPTDGGSRPGR